MSELQAALLARAADDVELTMMVDSVFGMDDKWVEPLIDVLEADWGHKREDAAFDLGHSKIPEPYPLGTRGLLGPCVF